MSKESKFLSRVLRHEPDLVGLSLGPGGWVLIDDVLFGMKKAGLALERHDLDMIIVDDDKRRFTLSDDGRRIRAAQGHSVAINLDLLPATPPDDLFHGTAATSLSAILAEGIKPGQRQHVHLSNNQETAAHVGQRHGRPVVLRIATGNMHGDGHNFWQADNGVWLINYVPPSYIFSNVSLLWRPVDLSIIST